jgi:hypothetical protein
VSGLRRAALFLLWFFIFLWPVSAVAAQTTSQPMAGGDSSGRLPVSLGKPAGCDWSNGRALNSGSYPEDLVIVGEANCPTEAAWGNSVAYGWQNGSWFELELPEGNFSNVSATSVSDDSGAASTFVYSMRDNDEGDGGRLEIWVKSPGAPPVELGVLPDMGHRGMAWISAQANHVVGGNQSGDWETGFIYSAVRWVGDGAAWSPPEDLGEGVAVAVTEDGSVVIGNGDGETWGVTGARPWVWTATEQGGSNMTLLEPDARVRDITHSGSMIVGSRPEPCRPDAWCDFFAAPVYWVLEDGQWTMHDLEALDGVESTAIAVAEVDGRPIILGEGFTNQQGGIPRAVVWLPLEGGGYGPALRLETLGGNFNTMSFPFDINRRGYVLGWSEIEPWDAGTTVLWSLFDEFPFRISGGISDAWYDPESSGQGFFITVAEATQTIFMAWMTYDTERPDGSASAVLGDPGHRWLTAQGSYVDDTAVLEITITEGGIFDAGSPAPERRQDGTLKLEFSSCVAGSVSYEIPSIGRQGVVPIRRISQDNVASCEKLAIPTQ